MNTIEQIKLVLNNFSSDIPYIETYSERLYFLLYGKNDKYEGPLYNGLQPNEWPMIILLISNWLYEVKETNKITISITQVSCEILKSLIKSNVIKISLEEQYIVYTILKNQQVINFVDNELEKITSKFTTCCHIFTPNIKTITNETGTRCTFANSIKSLYFK